METVWSCVICQQINYCSFDALFNMEWLLSQLTASSFIIKRTLAPTKHYLMDFVSMVCAASDIVMPIVFLQKYCHDLLVIVFWQNWNEIKPQTICHEMLISFQNTLIPDVLRLQLPFYLLPLCLLLQWLTTPIIGGS